MKTFEIRLKKLAEERDRYLREHKPKKPKEKVYPIEIGKI